MLLRELLPHDFTLAQTGRLWDLSSSSRSEGGMFLWHFPSSHLDRTLSCTTPYEARTFLSRERERPSGVLRVREYTIRS